MHAWSATYFAVHFYFISVSFLFCFMARKNAGETGSRHTGKTAGWRRYGATPHSRADIPSDSVVGINFCHGEVKKSCVFKKKCKFAASFARSPAWENVL